MIAVGNSGTGKTHVALGLSDGHANLQVPEWSILGYASLLHVRGRGARLSQNSL